MAGPGANGVGPAEILMSSGAIWPCFAGTFCLEDFSSLKREKASRSDTMIAGMPSSTCGRRAFALSFALASRALFMIFFLANTKVALGAIFLLTAFTNFAGEF